MSAPIICFGQQPCGIFPRRFLVAKIRTARRLQAELGGEIVFFCHDSDHDPRETKTILHHRKLDERLEINFIFDNPWQKKFSPLYLKRVRDDWRERTARQLPAYVEKPWVDAFKSIDARNVADFCLQMYEKMGLLEGLRVVRSSDPTVRREACDVADYFVDVPFQDEIVRARRMEDGRLTLHKGGDVFITLPPVPYTREQISPARDTRLRWMQSVVHCTHYVCGASEQDYLRREDAPEIVYVNREEIERSHDSFTDYPA